jgi:molybdenum cofactor guanylyltransferase
MSPKQGITAVILAGGRGSRMGGIDKGLVEFNGKPLIEHVIAAIVDQVDAVIINANRNREEYATYGYPVVADSMGDYQGPLAGFLAAMEAVSTSDILCVPCDGPLLADNLAQRLVNARERAHADIAVAHDGHRLQPVYALIPIYLKESLQAYLDDGDRKIDLWYARHRMALADFSDAPTTFVNVNTPEERDELQAIDDR